MSSSVFRGKKFQNIVYSLRWIEKVSGICAKLFKEVKKK